MFIFSQITGISTTGIHIFVCLLCIIQLAHTSWWYLAMVGVSEQQMSMPPPGGPPNTKTTLSHLPKSRNGMVAGEAGAGGKPMTLEQTCNALDFLNSAQKRFCSRSAAIPRIVGRGAQWGLEECHHQFQHRKWNCSTFNETSIFGKVLEINGREKSFIYAISSAGVMLSITRACARGQLEICGCDRRDLGHPSRLPPAKQGARRRARGGDSASNRFRTAETWTDVAMAPMLAAPKSESTSPGLPNENTTWQWGGCSHDVNYGARFTRRFIDSMERKQGPDQIMNLWNNRAGRRAVKKTMRRLCKCHGVSGACTVQVCWRVVSDIREIGAILLGRYEGAAKMRGHPKRRRLRAFHPNMRRPSRDDLVYLADSPNYCYYDPRIGSLGTRGRECQMGTGPALGGAGSCSVMCCGRGYHSVVEEVVEACDCKFHWCCRVVCKQCRRSVERHYCH